MIDPIEEVRSPWVGWVVAIVHGGRYLGRISSVAAVPESAKTLAPVYELNVRLVNAGHNEDGSPKIGIVYSCMPVLMLAGWKRMRLPDDALICPLEDLALSERQRLMAAAQQGAAIADDMKREQSHIAQSRIVRP